LPPAATRRAISRRRAKRTRFQALKQCQPLELDDLP
jgi:hypothetical protein